MTRGEATTLIRRGWPVLLVLLTGSLLVGATEDRLMNLVLLLMVGGAVAMVWTRRGRRGRTIVRVVVGLLGAALGLLALAALGTSAWILYAGVVQGADLGSGGVVVWVAIPFAARAGVASAMMLMMAVTSPPVPGEGGDAGPASTGGTAAAVGGPPDASP